MGIGQHWRFFSSYVRRPHTVGAVAPSSRALAAALCEPYRRASQPATVLEVGAGTGAVTRHLGSLLRDDDRLDICEIEPDFAEILEQNVLTRPEFTTAVACGRVRLLRQPVQALSEEGRYDFVISGLPLTAFALHDVQDVFTVIRRSLKPGGVLSYFEYIGLRKTSAALALGRRRARVRAVSRYLTQCIRKHQFARETVLRNVPPAHARHFRFDS